MLVLLYSGGSKYGDNRGGQALSYSMYEDFRDRKPMRLTISVLIGALLSMTTLGADTLGFVQQKFGDLHFEKGKWSRTVQLPCYTYTAQVDGAVVEVLRFGMGNLVPFKAAKGLKVTVCGSVAAFDEGFETGPPLTSRMSHQQ
jgi:hypothetical protein